MGNSSSSQTDGRPNPTPPPPVPTQNFNQYPQPQVYGQQPAPFASYPPPSQYYGGYYGHGGAPTQQPAYPGAYPGGQTGYSGQYPPAANGGYSVPNPYGAQIKTQEYQRTATIRNQVNLKKPTLKLEKLDDTKYNITFRFDASAACRVCVFFQAQEDPSQSCKITTSKGAAGPAVYYEKGLDHAFPPSTSTSSSSSTATLDLDIHNKKDLITISNTTATPTGPGPAPQSYAIAVRLEALTDEGRQGGYSLESVPPGGELPHWVQSQTTYARVTEETNGDLGLRIIKQKIWVKGESYELQEIYGMERSNNKQGVATGTPSTVTGDAFEEVEGNECVICMSAPRDTAALPCRHMCMCHTCAGDLKTQTNKCPICRNEMEKLLHIKINKGPAPASQ